MIRATSSFNLLINVILLALSTQDKLVYYNSEALDHFEYNKTYYTVFIINVRERTERNELKELSWVQNNEYFENCNLTPRFHYLQANQPVTDDHCTKDALQCKPSDRLS